MLYTGVAGQEIELPLKEATNYQSCGFVEILPEDQQDLPPMAYETAKQAIKAETAKANKQVKKK